MNETAITRRVTIANKLGVHARAAAKFVTTANRFPCQVTVTLGEKQVDGKSIMSLMTLAAAKGTVITITTQGEQAREAMETLITLVGGRFGEEGMP